MQIHSTDNHIIKTGNTQQGRSIPTTAITTHHQPNPMANSSPYKCKTRSRPFRLPERDYQKAVDTVNASLKSFRLELSKEDAKEAESVLKDAIKRIKQIKD